MKGRWGETREQRVTRKECHYGDQGIPGWVWNVEEPQGWGETRTEREGRIELELELELDIEIDMEIEI